MRRSGTDFPPCDHAVKTGKIKGLLVIDTIPWALEADEIQAKGRTGRQDDPGCYGQLLLFEDVKRVFNTTNEEEDGVLSELSGGGLSASAQHEKFVEFIGQKRQVSETQTVDKVLADNASNTPRHDNTARLPRHLKRSNCDLLIQINK